MCRYWLIIIDKAEFPSAIHVIGGKALCNTSEEPGSK